MRYMREELLGEFDADDKTLSSLVIRYYANFAYSGYVYTYVYMCVLVYM